MIRFFFALTLFASIAFANLELDITVQGVASQTHSHGSGLYPAEHAIDGDLETFNHTSSGEPGAAWLLDFTEEKEISRVEVVTRNCCSGRLSNATLRLFNDAEVVVHEVVVEDGGPLTTFTVELAVPVMASRLRVGFEEGESGIVHLAEVRVFTPGGDPPVVDFFRASGNELSWSVTGADEVSIYGIGMVSANGSITVSPLVSTTFILAAENACATVREVAAVAVDGVAVLPKITEIRATPDDWVEIWNPGNEVLDLTGWALTDDLARPDKHRFSAGQELGSGDFLLVEDPVGLAREEGSFVALVNPAGVVVSRLTYPRQYAGGTYGEGLDGALHYFLSETPGDYNLSATTEGFLEGVTFSVERGFYDGPVSVSLGARSVGTTVVYSLDGSEPSVPYAGPIGVSTTTVLRAKELRAGYVDSPMEAHTYLYLADVVDQPEFPAGFPVDWQPVGASGALAPIPRPSDYEMDPNIAGDMVAALQQVPTISLTLPNEEMWGLESGLHANADRRGRDWEKEASMEVLYPGGVKHAHYNCGIRIHGGRGRVREMLRKSFRLYFRSDYGDSKFEEELFPNFPKGGVDHLVLRGGTGRTWASPWRARTGSGNSLTRVTYLRDQFYRDCQREMGNPSIGGTFAHLYLNGLYWGLYNPVERPGENYGANHFGGKEEDYDVLKWANGLETQVTHGEIDGWEELRGLTGGTPADDWAAIWERLDVENLIDYMMVNFYVGNQDWVRNNVYGFRRREGGDDNRFRFLCWDGEETFISLTRNSTTDGRDKTTTPLELHDDLRAGSEEYRLMFADRIHKHLRDEDGVLTTGVARARHEALAASVDQAILGQSARWGDLFIDDVSDPGLRYNREDHWLTEVANINDTYLVQRPAISFAHMKADNLYPDTEPPVASVDSGKLNLSAREGVIYYTLDGSDPREEGGAVNGGALVYDATQLGEALFAQDAEWAYLDEDVDLSGTNWVVAGYDDSGWDRGNAPLGYGTVDGIDFNTEISFGGDIFSKPITSYFRHRFVVADPGAVGALLLRYVRDDGLVVYLNGVEIDRSNLPQGPITGGTVTLENGDESAVFTREVSPDLLVAGENVIAVELHQRSDSSSDVGFDLGLIVVDDGLLLGGDARVRTRVLSGGEWSALEDETFRVQVPAETLVVTEVMYHPADPGAAELAAGFDDDDYFEFIEVRNISEGALLLDGFRFSKGVNVALSGTLEAGGYGLVVANRAAFEMRYGTGLPILAEWPAGEKLDNGGELIRLRDHENAVIFEFEYFDDGGWSELADGDGPSLVLRQSGSFPGLGEGVNWRASALSGGTPGGSDAVAFRGGDLIAYALPVIGVPQGDGSLSAVLNVLADDVSVFLERSVDLGSWETVEELTYAELPDGRRELRYVPGAGEGKGFYRFRVRRE